MSESYSIMCDARAGFDLGIDTLALVDRRLSKKYFWTSDNPSIIMWFSSKFEAENALKKIKYNRPRIIESKYAIEYIHDQGNEIDTVECDELGWDEHKYAY